jgi:hypothetical protein
MTGGKLKIIIYHLNYIENQYGYRGDTEINENRDETKNFNFFNIKYAVSTITCTTTRTFE